MLLTGVGGFFGPAAGGGNAFTLITTGQGTGALPLTSGAIDTTGADLLVAAFSYFDAGGVSATMSDSNGNTWTALTNRTTGFFPNRLFYCRGGTVGSGHTFTMTGGGAGEGAIAIQAWSGSNATPFDVENGAGVTASSISTGSVTPAVNNSLIIASASGDANPTGIDSGFTASHTINKTASNKGLLLAYLKQNTAAAVNPTITFASSQDCNASIAVFKP